MVALAILAQADFLAAMLCVVLLVIIIGGLLVARGISMLGRRVSQKTSPVAESARQRLDRAGFTATLRYAAYVIVLLMGFAILFLFEPSTKRSGTIELPAPAIPIAIGLAGLAGFFYGFRQWGRFKMIQSMPTSKVASMAAGLVELYGRAVSKGGPLLSPFAKEPCLYYAYVIERIEGKRTALREGEKFANFYLDDGTGRVEVDPRGADFPETRIEKPPDYQIELDYGKSTPEIDEFFEMENIPKLLLPKFAPFSTRLRYKEWRIAPGEQLYVLGTATPRMPPPQSARNEDLLIVKQGTTERHFYISYTSEKELLPQLRVSALLLIIGGAALAVTGLAVALARSLSAT